MDDENSDLLAAASEIQRSEYGFVLYYIFCLRKLFSIYTKF